MAAHPINTSHRRPGNSTSLALSIAGLSGIAALLTALVWVLEGQVQQAKILRSQWQNEPGSARANLAMPPQSGPTTLNVGAGISAIPAVNKNAIVATSLNRP